jgi:hypothetical protein
VAPVTSWKTYRSENGGFGMEVPRGWTISERGGAGGYETTIAADGDNRIVVSQQILPGGLEGRIIRSDTRDRALIGAVQAHYERLQPQYARFRGEAPVAGTVANMFAGSGSFTCQTRGGFMRPQRELKGRTAVLIGLDNLYVIDAFADVRSWAVMNDVFDHVAATFKHEE